MKKRITISLILLSLLAFLSIRDLIISSGVLGGRHDWPIPPYPPQIYQFLTRYWYIWDGVHGYNYLYPTLLYARVIFGFLALIVGFNGVIFSKLILWFLIFLAGSSMYYLLKRAFKLGTSSSLMGAVVYMFSPVVYNRAVAGYLLYLFSYGIAPLVVAYFKKSLTEKKYQWAVLSGILYGISFAQLQFGLMVPLILLGVSLIEAITRREYLHTVKSFAITIIIGMLLQVYWILPLFRSFDNDILKVGSQLSPLDYWEVTHAPNIIKAFLLVGYPHPYDITWLLKTYPLLKLTLLGLGGVSSLSILTLISKRQKEDRLYFLMFGSLLFLSILLVTAVNSPFKNLWVWLYLNTPLRIFREVYHLMFLVAFPISWLFAKFIDDLDLYYANYNVKKVFSVAIIILMLILYSYPLLSGDLLGQIDTLEFPKEYQDSYNYLLEASQTKLGRVVYLPMLAVKYNFQKNPESGPDLVNMYSPLPTIDEHINRGHRLQRYGTYLLLSLRERPSSDILNATRSAGIRYFFSRLEAKSIYLNFVPSSEEEKKQWESFQYDLVLNKIRGLKKVSFGNISIYYDPESPEFVRVSQIILVASGSYDILRAMNTSNIGILYTIDILSSTRTQNNIVRGSNIALLTETTPFSMLLCYGCSVINPSSPFTNPTDTQWVREDLIWWRYPVIASQILPSVCAQIPRRISELAIVTSKLTDKDLIFRLEFGNTTSLFLENRNFKMHIWDETMVVETNTTTQLQWSWIRTKWIPVTPGDVLFIKTYMGGINVKQSHIAIEGMSKNGRIRQLIQVPSGQDGTFKLKEFNTTMIVPENITAIRFVLNAGWVLDPSMGTARTIFKGVEVYNITNYTKPVTLDIPFKVDKTDNYKLFIRYFKNQKGGAIRVYLDGTPIYIRTKDQLNKFVWEDLGTFNLEKGEHKIVLENVRGFNAVNLFALIPENEYNKARKEAIELLQNKTIIYLFEAESDLYRENVEIIKDFNASNGEAIKFNQKGKAWQNVEIVKNSTYRLALKGNGTFNISIGDYKYVLTVNNSTFEYTPLFYLRNGEYKLEITPTSKDALLDVVWLYSTNNNETLEELFQTNETPATVQNYTKINPTLWKVKVNATKPFFLTFAESYDPLWEARVYKNGKLVEKVSPVPVYGVINGFWINQTGNLEIVLRYTPQDWFERGLIISLTTFILSVFYIFYDWRREKGDKWAKRLERKAKKFLDKLKQRIRFKNLRKLFM